MNKVLEYFNRLYQLTDGTNYPEMSGDYYKGYHAAMEVLHEQLMDAEPTIREALQSMQWRPIEEAPRYEKMFVCRKKSKPHVTFEAMLFRDRESWEIPEEYDVLQNMTIDEPICDYWEDYEWRPITPPEGT